MKLNLANTRLEYRREEMMDVMNAIASAAAVLKEARLATNDRNVIDRLDFALNKLVCEIPDKLSVS